MPTPEEALREALDAEGCSDPHCFTHSHIRQALGALDQLLQERDDRAAERDLAWEARDGWRAASDEKLAENARLQADLDMLRADLAEARDYGDRWRAKANELAADLAEARSRIETWTTRYKAAEDDLAEAREAMTEAVFLTRGFINGNTMSANRILSATLSHQGEPTIKRGDVDLPHGEEF